MKNQYIKILSSFAFVFLSCRSDYKEFEKSEITEKKIMFTKEEILHTLDNYGKEHNFEMFPNLGHGYFHLAGTKLNLFADSTRWAIVFETIGYNNRQESIVNMTYYFGNCLTNMLQDYGGKLTWSNMYDHWRASPEYLKSLYEDYELLNSSIDSIKIGAEKLKIERDLNKYLNKGIRIRDHHNPNKQIDVIALTRYLVEENYSLFVLSESEIREHLPSDLPKLMEIKDWYHKDYIYYKPIDSYEGQKPSTYDTFNMIAEVLVSKDTTKYDPKVKPNTHWSNWPESGGM